MFDLSDGSLGTSQNQQTRKTFSDTQLAPDYSTERKGAAREASVLEGVGVSPAMNREEDSHFFDLHGEEARLSAFASRSLFQSRQLRKAEVSLRRSREERRYHGPRHVSLLKFDENAEQRFRECRMIDCQLFATTNYVNLSIPQDQILRKCFYLFKQFNFP